MAGTRNRTKQTTTLDERLLKMAADCRTRAGQMKPGKAQDELLEKARQFEAQVGMSGLFQPTLTQGRTTAGGAKLEA
jgi:hypothetical protein